MLIYVWIFFRLTCIIYKVGLTEEQAVAEYGASDVDCYISSFAPLEWALATTHTEGDGDHAQCFAKVSEYKVEVRESVVE
jgi:hypothetical protein